MPYASLTKRFDSGPWWGIAVTPERHAQVTAFAADLSAQTRPGDRLLIFYQAPGYYLFWPGDIAANSYWLANDDSLDPLPQSISGLLPAEPRRADRRRPSPRH